jgi:hypothetical protein
MKPEIARYATGALRKELERRSRGAVHGYGCWFGVSVSQRASRHGDRERKHAAAYGKTRKNAVARMRGDPEGQSNRLDVRVWMHREIGPSRTDAFRRGERAYS